jgi:hypothetical protein
MSEYVVRMRIDNTGFVEKPKVVQRQLRGFAEVESINVQSSIDEGLC